MKTITHAHGILPLALLAMLFPTTLVRGDQTWTGTSGSGGDGVWDTGITPSWDATGGDPATSQAWNDLGVSNDSANFTTAPGAVTVSDSGIAPVDPETINFNASAGTYDLTGDDIVFTGTSNTDVTLASTNQADVVIDSNLQMSGSPGSQYNFVNSSAAKLTLNGNITLAANLSSGQQIRFDANGAGQIAINGSVSGAGNVAEADFGFGGGTPNAVYVLGPNADFSGVSNGINIANGTLLLETSHIGTQVTLEYGSVSFLTNAAVTDSSRVLIRGSNSFGTVGGNSADVSGFSGEVHVDDDQALTVTAAAGGRVNFTGTITGELPIGLVKTGAGTVVLSGSAAGTPGTGNAYAVGTGNSDNGTVAADLQAGTTLITNSSGSAFGNNHGVVNVETGAVLGGSGISTQTIHAVGAGSVIAAGDSGADLGTASIGTLHLTGGITATSGLTMDFKLTSPGVNDALDLGAGNFALSGNVTVNLSAFGDFQAGTFTLASGSGGVWSDDGATFTFTAPAGDSVTSYDFNTTTDQFTVTIAAPEPSTYALMGLGVLALVWFARRKNAQA